MLEQIIQILWWVLIAIFVVRIIEYLYVMHLKREETDSIKLWVKERREEIVIMCISIALVGLYGILFLGWS